MNFILLLLLINLSWAAFEEKEITARALSLSGAYSAISDDIDGMVYNPAGIATTKLLKISLSEGNYYNLFAHRFFGFMLPVSKPLTMALYFEKFAYQDLYKEQKIIIGCAIKIRNVSLGLTSNIFGLEIKDIGVKSNVSFSAGAQIDLLDYLSFGISAINFPQMNFSGEKIPTRLKLGLKFIPVDHMLFALDYDYGNYKFGAEISPSKYFVVRTGLNSSPLNASFGVGINVWKIKLDYGLSYHQQLELRHILTFSIQHEFMLIKLKPQKEQRDLKRIEIEEHEEPEEYEEYEE